MDHKTRDILALSQLKQTNGSAVVRQMLDEIENAMAAGVSRESIWKALCEAKGLSLSFKGFTQALFRARQARDGRAVRQPVRQQPAAPSPVSSTSWLGSATHSPAPAASPPKRGLRGLLSGLMNWDGSS